MSARGGFNSRHQKRIFNKGSDGAMGGRLTNDALDANKVRNVDVALELLAAVAARAVEFTILVGVEAVDVQPSLAYTPKTPR